MDDNTTNLVWACDGSHDGAEQHAAFLKRIENDGMAVIEWVSTGDITTVPLCQISRELKSRRRTSVVATIKKSTPASSSSKVTAATTAVGTWKCHKCNATNPPERKRCDGCLGWKGGVRDLSTSTPPKSTKKSAIIDIEQKSDKSSSTFVAAVGTWKCHKCDTTNPPSRSRCEGCLGWKGGVRVVGYSNSPSSKSAHKIKTDHRQSVMPNDPPSRSSSTQPKRSRGRPPKSMSSSQSLNAAPNHTQYKNKNMLQEENPGKRKRQRNIKYQDFVMDNSSSLKSSAGKNSRKTDNTVVDIGNSSILDREFAKSVAQDSSRRSIRERSAPELFVARPSKSGVGVRDGDEEFLKSCTTVAAAAAKKSGNARGRRDHESDGEEEDSLDCSKLNRQKWSAKEDKELIKRVRLHGAGNWKTILDNSPILQERYSNAPSGELRPRHVSFIVFFSSIAFSSDPFGSVYQ